VPPASLTGAVPPGYVLAGRYALVRLIARGGMADVWEAKDTLLERQVAVKILHPHLAADAAFVARFRTEAIAAARLHHRSIVAIFDTCSDNGIEAIVMELARGHTLREEIDRHGALDPVVVVNVGVDVADALQSAHAAGLIHRDVKPANILLCDDQRVMVTDFGIAKVRDNSDRTQTGTMLGSVKYVSPEQVEGNPVDPRSDVYSLGVVLYEGLTGQPPFVADTPAATALARLHSTPPHPGQLRRDAPRALTDLIMRAMALDPAQRYASASDLRAALLAVRIDPRGSAGPGPDATAVTVRPNNRGGATTAAPAVPPLPSRPSAPLPPPPARTTAANGARWGSLIVAVALIAFALIVAAILITQTNNNQRGPNSSSTQPGESNGPPESSGAAAQGSPISLQAAGAFDPDGDGREKDSNIGRALDGDGRTAWLTEYYQDPEFKTVNKRGVGMIVSAAGATKLGRLEVDSDSSDWSANVYVSKSKAGSLEEWGQPAGRIDSARAGTTKVDLKDAEGQYVLLWITKLASGPPGPDASGPANLTVWVNEVRAFAS
jgi:tRNA A-37 threonylcarbamoyl transferase component Bud32